MFMWAFENTVLEDSKKKYKKTIRIKSPYHFYNFPEIFDKISVVFFLIKYFRVLYYLYNY